MLKNGTLSKMSFQQHFIAFFFKRNISEGNEAHVLFHCDLKYSAAAWVLL